MSFLCAFLLSQPFLQLGKTTTNPFHQCEEFFKQSNYDKAIIGYEKTLPHVFDQHTLRAFVNYAEALLAKGLYAEGFRFFDWRLHLANERDQQKRITKLTKPWDGSDPKNKTIVIYAEQGHGDTFFFLRNIKKLNELGAHTILVVKKLLHPILTHCDFIDQLITDNEPLPDYDADVFMMSLPRYVSSEGLRPTTVETIVNRKTIKADQSLIEQYAQQPELQNDTFKIGICWRASALPAGQTRQLQRDIPLKLLMQLNKLKNIKLYNLLATNVAHRPLYESEFKQRAALGTLGILDEFDCISDDCPPLYSFEEKNGAFVDTAALMHYMDLIISVDTSIACLAGALHLPVWILLPYESDWRWMTERTDTPWYPTARLFRQTTQGEWESVMEDIVEALEKLGNKPITT